MDTPSASCVTMQAAPEPCKQPFHVMMYPQAAFLCDLHAHLCHHEIIGLLGGRWDEDTGVLHVCMAAPCRALCIDDDANVNVEMDPMSHFEAQTRIADAGFTVVGWYHSHPLFQPEPSVRDIENQHQCVPHIGGVGLRLQGGTRFARSVLMC